MLQINTACLPDSPNGGTQQSTEIAEIGTHNLYAQVPFQNGSIVRTRDESVCDHFVRLRNYLLQDLMDPGESLLGTLSRPRHFEAQHPNFEVEDPPFNDDPQGSTSRETQSSDTSEVYVLPQVQPAPVQLGTSGGDQGSSNATILALAMFLGQKRAASPFPASSTTRRKSFARLEPETTTDDDNMSAEVSATSIPPKKSTFQAPTASMYGGKGTVISGRGAQALLAQHEREHRLGELLGKIEELEREVEKQKLEIVNDGQDAAEHWNVVDNDLSMIIEACNDSEEIRTGDSFQMVKSFYVAEIYKINLWSRDVIPAVNKAIAFAKPTSGAISQERISELIEKRNQALSSIAKRQAMVAGLQARMSQQEVEDVLKATRPHGGYTGPKAINRQTTRPLGGRKPNRKLRKKGPADSVEEDDVDE